MYCKRLIDKYLLEWASRDSHKPQIKDISEKQYEYALDRIEELLPLVSDETPSDDKNAIELAIVSDVVEAYEKIHYPI
ncbi:MAG: hypothetical protein HDS52_05275 [Barnesiella sp.]|nr:hypothetical protein [Barnesiella sp.]